MVGVLKAIFAAAAAAGLALAQPVPGTAEAPLTLLSNSDNGAAAGPPSVGQQTIASSRPPLVARQVPVLQTLHCCC